MHSFYLKLLWIKYPFKSHCLFLVWITKFDDVSVCKLSCQLFTIEANRAFNMVTQVALIFWSKKRIKHILTISLTTLLLAFQLSSLQTLVMYIFVDPENCFTKGWERIFQWVKWLDKVWATRIQFMNGADIFLFFIVTSHCPWGPHNLISTVYTHSFIEKQSK